MSGYAYQVEVVSREEILIVGLKVNTTMARAAEDCPRLWRDDFGPRMPEAASFPGDSYGVSVMTDAEHFDYWAALPFRPGDPVPAGMSTAIIPAGLYAECRLESLAALAGAYQHIFSAWLPASGYDLPHDLPSCEVYPSDHLQTGRLTLYMPVRLKEKT